MDPFNTINPFDRDHAAVSQPQEQQAEFEPYLDGVPQPDAPAVAEIPASSDPYYFPLSEEERSLIEALELGHQGAHGPHPEDALTRHLGDTAAWHSAPREAWTWPKELPAEGHDQNPLRGMMGEPALTSALPTVRDHQGPDRGKAVRQFNWSDGYQPARNELTGSAPSSSHEVLTGEDYTGELRPAKRQRTLSHTEGDAIERQVSEPGSSVVREPMEDAGAPFQASDRLVLPAEGYDQDLLWAMVGNAGASPSVEPTEGHHQGLDSEPAVIPFNFRQGDQHASAALDRSNVAPSQDSRPNSFIVHNDRYTALFVPAATMRRSTPLPPGAAIPLGFRLENAPQPSAQPANRASSSRGRSIEQAAPASSSRAEGTSPAPREIYAASFAVPENFSHGDQPAPDTMLSKLRRWGQVPNEAQPAINYDIRGERYTALLGPGGPNDVRLIHDTSNVDAERQSPRLRIRNPTT